ncbi:ATP-binding protein [Streptomyces sp. NPDC002851]
MLLTPTTWSAGYPLTRCSPRLARLHTRSRLTLWAWPGDIDDAVLVVSELVTNAVRHGCLPGHELRLRLTRSEVEGDGGLTVDVSDPVRDFPGFPAARIRPPGLVPERGRGLLLVAGLAEELTWFVRDGVGKTVRARLGTNSPA